MKKTVITILIVLGMVLNASAQLINKLDDWYSEDESYSLLQSSIRDGGQRSFSGGGVMMPEINSLSDNPAYPSSDAPIGGGVMLLIGFGAAYAIGKKGKNE